MRMGCHSARSSREEWRRRRSPKIEHDLESRSYSGEYFDRLQTAFFLGCVVTPTRRCVCRDQPRTAGPRFSDRPRLSVASALAGLHVLPVVGAGGWRAGAAAAAAEDAVGAAGQGGGNAPAEPAPPAPVRHDRLHTTALAGLRPRTDGLSLWFRLCKPPLLGDYIELEA